MFEKLYSIETNHEVMSNFDRSHNFQYQWEYSWSLVLITIILQ